MATALRHAGGALQFRNNAARDAAERDGAGQSTMNTGVPTGAQS
jgi:hypothetical protein